MAQQKQRKTKKSTKLKDLPVAARKARQVAGGDGPITTPDIVLNPGGSPTPIPYPPVGKSVGKTTF
jgi:hypothetical protein